MKISSALKKIRKLRNELKRKIKIRKDNFHVIIPKNKTLEDIKQNPNEYKIIDIQKISDELNEITRKITDLREQILKTNVTTMAEVEGETISLSKLKLLIDDMRSELAQLEGIDERGYLESRRRKIKTQEEEEKEIPQLTDLELEKLIKDIEEKKINYENILEYMNATTELVE